ncbi:MAG: hypothetical protein ACK5XN_08275 [Bacteroidota bacterium]|jgi:hypothetical protein
MWKQVLGAFWHSVEKIGLAASVLLVSVIVEGLLIFHLFMKIERLETQVKDCQQDQVQLLKEVVINNTEALIEYREQIKYMQYSRNP